MYVYLLTDSERKHLTAWTCLDIKKAINFKAEMFNIFLKNYRTLHKIVYLEQVQSKEFAKIRLTELTMMPREYKEQLVESVNPEWTDLTAELLWVF